MLELAKAIVSLNMDTGPFDKQLALVEGRVAGLGSRLGGLSALGGATLTMGLGAITGLAAGLAATVKVAGDLEAQYTTLSRVTGLSADETKRLADNLKGLATTKAGITLEEINKVAEFAGRMGVGGNTAKGKIEGITQVASDLSDLKLVLSDMDIEDAATRMIRILNVFGKGVGDLRSFGSALVGVDNASTATGQELLEMVNRMQGMGSTLGATIPQLIALAGVMRDAGVEVDSGSTAIGQLGFKLSTSPDKFAKAVRMTDMEARQLGATIVNNPVKAIGMWMAALKKMDSASQMKALTSLHMTGRMSGQILLQLAQKIGDVDGMLQKSNDEWTNQKSLQDGVAKSSQTVWAQMSLLGNQMKVAAANVGEYVLPVFSEFIGLIGDVMHAIGELLGAGAPTFKAFSDIAVSAIQWVRDKFQDLIGWINQVTVTFKIVRAVWPSIMEEAGLQVMRSLHLVGYTFNWLQEVAGSFLNWFASNWQTVFTDMLTVFANVLKSQIEMIMAQIEAVGTVFSKQFELIKGMNKEIMGFIIDPLNHKFTLDVQGILADMVNAPIKAINRIGDAMSLDTLTEGVVTDAPAMPEFNSEPVTRKFDELIKAVREQRTEDMVRIAGELLKQPEKKKEEKKAAPKKEEIKKKGSAATEGGEAGKTFSLEQFRNHIQEALMKNGASTTPEKHLALAEEQAKKQDALAASQEKEAKALQAKVDLTNKKLDAVVGAIKNPVFQA
jgi:TP901 family phage tail tape measure protein